MTNSNRCFDSKCQNNKETMKQAGYKHIETRLDGNHILEDIETGKREVWFTNRNHASYGIIYKNTHLEFAYSLPTINLKGGILCTD